MNVPGKQTTLLFQDRGSLTSNADYLFLYHQSCGLIKISNGRREPKGSIVRRLEAFDPSEVGWIGKPLITISLIDQFARMKRYFT